MKKSQTNIEIGSIIIIRIEIAQCKCYQGIICNTIYKTRMITAT